MGQMHFYVDYLVYFVKDIYKNKDRVRWNSKVGSYFLFHICRRTMANLPCNSLKNFARKEITTFKSISGFRALSSICPHLPQFSPKVKQIV